jgi:flagellar motor switch/type III secretory pathway protein FliN
METKALDKQVITSTLESSRDEETADMSVVVRVEIGQVELTVDQATNLAPGRMLKLTRDVGPEVDLKVGDRLIGRGEMVEHEGRLAVEVTEVL